MGWARNDQLNLRKSGRFFFWARCSDASIGFSFRKPSYFRYLGVPEQKFSAALWIDCKLADAPLRERGAAGGMAQVVSVLMVDTVHAKGTALFLKGTQDIVLRCAAPGRSAAAQRAPGTLLDVPGVQNHA